LAAPGNSADYVTPTDWHAIAYHAQLHDILIQPEEGSPVADDSGDKTEPATPKKLRDARKKGEVAKSRDIGTTFGLMFAILILWQVLRHGSDRLAKLMIDAFSIVDEPFLSALHRLGADAVQAGLVLSAMVLLPVALFALLLEFMQTGPIVTIEKMLPKMSHLNPAEGVKRMFSMDNMVELIKSVLKTALLFAIGWMVVRSALPDLLLLPQMSPMGMVQALSHVGIRLFGWVLVSFALLTALDTGYQHYSFAKKMKMSMREIKDEHKNIEGDPLVKGQRRQLAQEWSQQSAQDSARNASVLVVNPTHVAIAISYDRETEPVPIVTATGEDHVARSMRDAAEDAQVPILRNELLARTLLADAESGDPVPRALFDIVAEVILWARAVQEQLEAEQADSVADDEPVTAPEPPGEDLTRYPYKYGPVPKLI